MTIRLSRREADCLIDNKYISDYIEKYKAGKIKLNKRRQKLIELLENDVLKRDDLYFDEDKIGQLVEFSAKYFFEHTSFQKFCDALLFLYKKDDGEPFFDRILLVLGRGAGKNGWITTISLFLISELNGVRGYNVGIVANSLDQAMTSVDEINDAIDNYPDKLGVSFYNLKQKITSKAMNATITPRTSNVKTKDGARDSLVVFDEIHAYENDAIVNVFESGLGKVPESRSIMIGSMGYVRGAYMDQQLDVADKVLNGDRPASDLLPIIAQLDDESQVDDDDNWELANPMLVKPLSSYGKMLFGKMQKQYRTMDESDSARAEFMTKRMNLPAMDANKSVASKDEIMATKQSVEVPPGSVAIGAVDFSSVRDFTAVGLLFYVDGKYVWQTHSFATRSFVTKYMGYNLAPSEIKGSHVFAPLKEWESKGDLTIIDEPTISPTFVTDWFDEKRDFYTINQIVMDNFRAELLRQSFLQAGYNNLDVIKKPKAISGLLAPRIEEGFANETFAWGDVPIMRWYTWNVLVHVKSDGNREYLKKEERKRKTDGFMAFLYAMYRSEELTNGVDVAANLEMLADFDF